MNALPAGAEREALQERLEAVKAEMAVAKAEASKSQADIDAAQARVTALPAGAKKDSLQQRLDVVVVTVELGKLTDKTAIEVAEVAGEETEAGITAELTDGLTVAAGYTLSVIDYSYDRISKVVSYKLVVANATGTATATSDTTIEADVTTAAVDPILEEARYITNNRDPKLVFTKTLLPGTTATFGSYNGMLDSVNNAFDFAFSNGATNGNTYPVTVSTPADETKKVAAGTFTYGIIHRPAVTDDLDTPEDESADAYWEIVQ